jgi:hypothetical protein
MRTALILSAVIAAIMVGASVAGLFVPGLYHETAWAREALRGGDLVSLAIVTPVLLVAMWLAAHGSSRAMVVWLGVLGYTTYIYAYDVFGTTFNDAFLAHIVLFSVSVFALCYMASIVDRHAIEGAIRLDRTTRFVGAYLLLVGIAQGGLWVVLILRNAFTGALMADIPASGQHLVFALDLGVLMPAMVIAGYLLLRHRPLGAVVGPAAAVTGTLVLTNLVVAAAVQRSAHVVGVKGVTPDAIFLVATMLASTAALLRRRA